MKKKIKIIALLLSLALISVFFMGTGIYRTPAFSSDNCVTVYQDTKTVSSPASCLKAENVTTGYLKTENTEMNTSIIKYSAEGTKTLKAINETPCSESELTTNFKMTKGSVYNELYKLIKSMEADGAMVSFIMADINTNKVVAYNPDKQYTSQSTVKAPYIVSLLAENPDLFEQEKETIKQLITVSDNDAFEYLYFTYGSEVFDAWCSQLKIEFMPEGGFYPRNATVRNFADFWVYIYDFLNKHSLKNDPLKEFTEYFTGTAQSAIFNELGSRYTVQTKAGWEDGSSSEETDFYSDDPMADKYATNDTGIIYSSSGPYILCIFTSYPNQPELVQPLVNAIDRLHSTITTARPQ